MNNLPENAAAVAASTIAHAAATSAQVAPLKYATEIRTIAKCPVQPNYKNIDLAYRFASSDLESPANFLPVALLQPERTLPNNKPIKDCCAGWSLSMYTTLDALQSKARKTIKTAPKFLKRVGDHYTQIKLTESCGVHTDPNSEGHFEFFERSTFDGRQAVVSHGKLAI